MIKIKEVRGRKEFVLTEDKVYYQIGNALAMIHTKTEDKLLVIIGNIKKLETTTVISCRLYGNVCCLNLGKSNICFVDTDRLDEFFERIMRKYSEM